MRWARPKSLSSLMLLGLALIAGPLLVAVVDAAIQIRRLTAASQDLVQEGVQGARLSQSMFADIDSLGRTVRLYQVLGDVSLLENYRSTDQQLASTREQLSRLLDDDATRRSLEDFAAMHNEISSAVGATPSGSAAFTNILARIDKLKDMANDIAKSGNAQIDARLRALQQHTASTQRRMFWQSALLVPLTLVAIL